MTKQPLYMKMAFVPAYTEAVRLIGYSGCLMSEFWERAKALGIPTDKLRTAVYDLTRSDKREEKVPRYELSGPARHAAIQVLGFPPEHPMYTPKEPPGEEQGECQGEEPTRPKARRRGRSR